MSVARTVVAFPSPADDRNYFQAMVDRMVEYCKQLALGYIARYEEIMSYIDAKDKGYAIRVFRAAARRVEIHHGIFFKNRYREGYERVPSEEALEVCKAQINYGMRKVKRGAERTHSIDMNQLSDNQKAEVVGIQSAFGRLQLMYDTAGS